VMLMNENDIALLYLATNARFRIASRLTTRSQTGYQIRPECDIMGRKTIPAKVSKLLKSQGLPVQQRYTKPEHLTRLLRLVKPFKDFTKDPEGYESVVNWEHWDEEPLKTHADVLDILGRLENESV